MLLKTILKVAIILLFFQNGISQKFDETFVIKISPDQGLYLELNKDNTYNYHIWNGYSINRVIISGQYSVEGNLISFHCEYKDSTYTTEFPKELFHRTVRLNNHRQLTNYYAKTKSSILGTKFLVLFREEFKNPLTYKLKPGTKVLFTTDQYKRERNKAYFLSENEVFLKKKWNHKKLDKFDKASHSKSELFKEICSFDKTVLRQYQTEINNSDAIFDHGLPFQIIYFNEAGVEVEKFEFYFYTIDLSPETLLFVNKLRKLFDEI